MGEVILKLVNATDRPSASTVELTGVREIRAGTLTVLQSDDPQAVNTMENPDRVAPHTTAFSPAGPAFPLLLPAHSFTLLRIGAAK